MFEQLYENIHQHVSLTDEEWEQCKNSFNPKKMRNRQYLLQEGDICRNIAFIEEGGLYFYSTYEKGNQLLTQISFEGWWMLTTGWMASKISMPSEMPVCKKRMWIFRTVTHNWLP